MHAQFEFFCNFFAEEDARRPNQRPTTAMLGNEVMSKEQCYDLYQQILGVKKFEHQLLYNAMQVSTSNISPYSPVSNSICKMNGQINGILN